MSDDHTNENKTADIRTEPGKWVVNLVEGMYELAKRFFVAWIVPVLIVVVALTWRADSNKPKPIMSFRPSCLRAEHIGLTDNYAQVEYIGEDGPLVGVDMIFRVTLRDAQVKEFKRYLGEWPKSETVRFVIEEAETVERVEMRGTAELNGKQYPIDNAWTFDSTRESDSTEPAPK